MRQYHTQLDNARVQVGAAPVNRRSIKTFLFSKVTKVPECTKCTKSVLRLLIDHDLDQIRSGIILESISSRLTLTVNVMTPLC